MNGEELYALYVTANLHCNNCEIDQWEDLGNEERNVWEYIAVLVAEAEPGPPGPRPAVIR